MCGIATQNKIHILKGFLNMEHNTSIAIQNSTDDSINFTWLELPASEEDIQKALEKINALEDENFFVADYETDLELPKSDFNITSLAELEEFNSTLEDFEALDEWEQEEVFAILEFETMNLWEALDRQKRGCFLFHSGIENEYDLGEYYVTEVGCWEIPEYIRSYIDYEAYGKEIAYDGMFTAYGYIQWA